MYSVNPDRITIVPKSSCQLEFFGFSAQPGQIEERFICTLGNGVKSKQTVFDIVARSVINFVIVARSVVNTPFADSQQHLQPCKGACLHSRSHSLGRMNTSLAQIAVVRLEQCQLTLTFGDT